MQEPRRTNNGMHYWFRDQTLTLLRNLIISRKEEYHKPNYSYVSDEGINVKVSKNNIWGSSVTPANKIQGLDISVNWLIWQGLSFNRDIWTWAKKKKIMGLSLQICWASWILVKARELFARSSNFFFCERITTCPVFISPST